MFVPASVEGEGQLARAAAYIQERDKHCSFTSNEFPCHSPKVPPGDKQLIVVNNKTKAGNACALPIHYSEGEIESNRHSDKWLIESEEVFEVPGIAERWRSAREPLIRDWKTGQDGVTCFAVSQEASAAKEADDAVAPFRRLMAIKSDVPIHLPKPFAAFLLHLMVSTSTAQGFPHNWSSSKFNRLPVKFLASACAASSPSLVHFKSVTSQQTVPSSWSSHEPNRLIAESPKNGDCEW